jgi:hypothetical protein
MYWWWCGGVVVIIIIIITIIFSMIIFDRGPLIVAIYRGGGGRRRRRGSWTLGPCPRSLFFSLSFFSRFPSLCHNSHAAEALPVDPWLHRACLHWWWMMVHALQDSPKTPCEHTVNTL